MTQSTEPAARPPNIILILCDDMGYSDIGCYGSEIDTPNLDRLAAGGIRFSQTYNCARCCPSRASLLTGLYPHKAGIGFMLQHLDHPSYQGHLRQDTVTLAEALRPGGYRSMVAGKWHVGGFWSRRPGPTWDFNDPARPLPLDRGFDRYYGVPAGGNYFHPSPLIQDDHLIDPPEGFYTTDNYTDASIRFIEDSCRTEEPFFLHITYNAPHWPLHAYLEDIEKYRSRYQGGWDRTRIERHERLKEQGILDPGWDISPRDAAAPPWSDAPDHDWEDARMATYAAMVDRMDQNIGRLLETLERNGIAENTLIFFLSDNGGSAEFLAENGRKEAELPVTLDGREVRVGNIRELEPGPADTFMSYGLPWANVSNSPFRRFKSWVHEGGISTAMIVHGPGVAGSGRISHAVNHLVDIYATILDVAGVEYPEHRDGRAVQPLDGESFLPLLGGADWSRTRPLFWEHMGNCAVRASRWKLVCRQGRPWELFDMVDDRTELNDQAARHPDRVGEMDRRYARWAETCGVLPWDQVQAMARG